MEEFRQITKLSPVANFLAIVFVLWSPIYATDKLLERTFEVPVNFWDHLQQMADESVKTWKPQDPLGLGEVYSTNPFEDLGIELTSESYVLFNPEKGTLQVKATSDQLRLWGSIISKIPKLTFSEQKKFVSSIIAGQETHPQLIANPEIAEIEQSLNSTRIQKLKLTEVTLQKAISILQDYYKANNNSKGLSAIIDSKSHAIDDLNGIPKEGTNQHKESRFSLELANVSLNEAFRKAAALYGFKYRIESHALIFVPISTPEPLLKTIKYYMPLKFHTKLMASLKDAPADPFGLPAVKVEAMPDTKKLRYAIEQAGITFPEGSGTFYDEIKEELSMTNTRDQLDLLEALLSSLDNGKIILKHDSRFHRN